MVSEPLPLKPSLGRIARIQEVPERGILRARSLPNFVNFALREPWLGALSFDLRTLGLLGTHALCMDRRRELERTALSRSERLAPRYK